MLADPDAPIARLTALLDSVRKRGLRSLEPTALDELVRLYRYVSSRLSRLEARQAGDLDTRRLRALVFAAHGLIHGGSASVRTNMVRRTLHLFAVQGPAAIRAEWRLIVASLLALYGLAGIGWILVGRDLALAYSLMDPRVVSDEIAQLRALEDGAAFRGNFTFGQGESPLLAGSVMGNNLQVSVLFFASALVPPLYLLVLCSNALMLGTYTAVAGHWGQAGAISSILWCHGALEIQAIVLAGTAGLVLVRALIAPGPWSRAEALRSAGARAFQLLAPVLPMLVAAGLIEGYVSPHAGFALRVAVACASLALLLWWVLFCGRMKASPPAPVSGETAALGVEPSG